ncbi:MAG TPA: MBL fold metallo-hydrolase [Oceanospirillales bacterium]|nr:MBL fold metallo-hydrolase [Oceanospirillaceae bacterium]HBS41956.1 MBL fold metallo-hydrolase [Oceanospirillales bacterium]
MRYLSLGSGSRGNATLVEYRSSALLIDCGFSRRTLLQRLEQAGASPGWLQGVLVTHEHADHAKGILTVCDHLQIPFYTSFGTARKMDCLEHPLWRCIRSCETVKIGSMKVLPVVVPHDAHEPLQFVIESDDGHKLGILSDLGSLTPHLVDAYRGCHALQVEANHDPVMLQNGPYPPSLKVRVAGDYGHLSNEQCADFIRRVSWPGLSRVTVGHISEKNNHPDLVAQALSGALQCQPEDVILLEQDLVSDWYQVQVASVTQ